MKRLTTIICMVALGFAAAVVVVAMASFSSINNNSNGSSNVSGIGSLVVNAYAATAANTEIAAVGDIGCKSNSLKTLENIANSKLPMIGIGDYMYKCAPGDKIGGGDDRLGDLYQAITHKVGVEGNHEAENGQQEAWAEKTFQYPNDYAAWKLGDVGFIMINPYVAFKKGSDQYNFIVAKSKLFDANPRINWIVYVTHEPLYTPAVTGGHGANTALRDIIGPIIKEHNGFLLEGHNHVTAFGRIDGVNTAMCGSGGYGGDSLGKLNGFAWGTSSTFGHCTFQFFDNSIVAKMIGSNTEQVVRQYIFNK
jgi:hypothetical protein